MVNQVLWCTEADEKPLDSNLNWMPCRSQRSPSEANSGFTFVSSDDVNDAETATFPEWIRTISRKFHVSAVMCEQDHSDLGQAAALFGHVTMILATST
ncbi:hypothetical protein QO034_20320 [Sedimentitalea sp. JM2-8]|uniref:Uncharacterized protein n=1 Tax=Sedimentitalea xiamensis TaxID=3050037 RepID=A0ABT7FJW0_9RHOB|nr:hypothetical protein [Sedimentitalea xiamensis]MDK3075428.1 hypothetical protein [Sedimentitalea xiamensis]